MISRHDAAGPGLHRQELGDRLEAAGFAIDHQWQPSKGKAAFIVAEKPA